MLKASVRLRLALAVEIERRCRADEILQGRLIEPIVLMFLPNIFFFFFAKPTDYVRATQRIYHAAGAASFIELPMTSAK